MSRSGSGGDVSDMDGDNINVVIRVRPLSQKENRNHDDGIVQFPGEGQIWVRFKKSFILAYSNKPKMAYSRDAFTRE